VLAQQFSGAAAVRQPRHGSMVAMTQDVRLLVPRAQAEIAFSDPAALRRLDDPVAKDLSAVARVGECIFLACDEAAGLERVSRLPDGSFGAHRHIPLGPIFDLPEGPEAEMDIEGLAASGGYLWIVGSHAVKRRKADARDRHGAASLARLRGTTRAANRCFLGRLPTEEEAPGLVTPRPKVGERRAARLGMGGRRPGLLRWLAKDPHLAPFLDVPAKENGLDIEGLAVLGDRVWLGLRGPVLGGHAVVLELDLKQTKRGRLKPRRLTPDGQRYRKHLLDTAGLGVRDLRRDGEDLLLLVGPTMALEGTAHVLRWRGGVQDRAEGLVPADRLERVADLPYRRESDHPEGLDLWPDNGGGALLVVYDAPGPARLDRDQRRVRVDILRPAGESEMP
jgi:hypothetical protein